MAEPRAARTSELSRIVIWALVALFGGAVAGALIAISKTGLSDLVAIHDMSGSWRFALERAGVDRWAGAGAAVGFVVVMSVVAWRLVVGGVVGLALGVLLGALLGDAATSDSGAPVDIGFLVGVSLGAALGTLSGVLLGASWHLDHVDASRMDRPDTRVSDGSEPAGARSSRRDVARPGS